MWRAPTLADAGRLADLYDAWAEDGGLTWRVSAEEIAHEMTAPTASLADDYRVAEHAEGQLVASVVAHISSVDGFKHRAWLLVTSRPGFGELESPATQWGVARARRAFEEAGGDMPEVVRVNADVRNSSRIARFEALGFEICRYFVDMIRPLGDPIPPVSLPDGIRLETWQERWIRPSWETHCEAFADHWGSLPPSLDDWRHRTADPHFRPDLSVVAVAGDVVASYAFNAVFAHDWEHRRRKEGWIEVLGTRPEWRRRGLASAVIAESMRRFAAAGLDHAALDVDSANTTGALGLYERLGFVEVDRTVDLMKQLDGA